MVHVCIECSTLPPTSHKGQCPLTQLGLCPQTPVMTDCTINFDCLVLKHYKFPSFYVRNLTLKPQKVIATYVALKTTKLKVLWDEGIKLISIAKLHLEVLRAVKPKKFSPAAGFAGSLRSPNNLPKILELDSPLIEYNYIFCVKFWQK